ncbi:unnamed protein product, partial [Prorocentrum cordatum]
MMDHPLYTPDPRDASVIFLRHDTLRMCEWPDLLMLPGEDGREHGKCGCVDAGGDGYDGPALDNYSRSCGWCCPVGSHLFAATVQEVVRRLFFSCLRSGQDPGYRARVPPPPLLDNLTLWVAHARSGYAGLVRVGIRGVAQSDKVWLSACTSSAPHKITWVIAEKESTISREYGPIHTFVYFKNAQDTFFNCGEF